jgi:hypothetical protein
MKHLIVAVLTFWIINDSAFAQYKIDSVLPIRGLSIAAPSPQGLDTFLKFITEELASAGFNLLILRVDWNYAYETHPELRSDNPLSKDDVKKIVDLCLRHRIRIAPQINLLGHQSWAKHTGNLLQKYPQFDETPSIKTANYSGWPNPDGLYCKSYCPLHPEVHDVILPLIDELMDAFETKYFHAGMDEVFYIGDDKCPRCASKDKSKLFADEVTLLAKHIKKRGGRLMIWGDRLIDGVTTGIGEWEASTNDTWRAIDMIPKDVFICDWHYERPELTSVLFAIKGFDVATCPWRKPEIAAMQLEDMLRFRKNAPLKMASHFQGIIETIWSGTESFLKSYYTTEIETSEDSEAETLKILIREFKKLR